MHYYKSPYYTYQPSSTSQSTYCYSWSNKQDHTTTQTRGYRDRTGTSDHHSSTRRHPASLTSGYSQSSFDSPSSYLSSPKDLFGYEAQNFSAKRGTRGGAETGTASALKNEQPGESISGMLSNFSKALGKWDTSLYIRH